MFYFKIGFRNIAKNYRRSLITMVPTIIGMIACLLTQGFFNWNMGQMREATIRDGTGHYQLYARGFLESGYDHPNQFLIKDVNPIVKELRSLPGVELVTTRMAFNGILSSGEKSAIVLGEAGEPKNELKLNSYSGLIKGSVLTSETANGLIIGEGVAKKLSADIGDVLTLIGNMKDGGINAVDLELLAITNSGYSELDSVSALTPLGVIQNLLGINANVQRIVILLKRTEDMEKIHPEIKQIAEKYELEYRDWEALADFYQSLKLMNDVVFQIIILIVLAMVAFTISNTINMNISERVREIGTIRAQGTRRMQVALIIIVESSLLGAIGGFIGLVLCYLFIGFTELIGGFPVLLSGAEQPLRIFFRPDITTIFICMLLFSMVGIIASFIPARRAGKLSITDALRWI
ncbi:MAG: ABC transporter permease [Firmicutes bacterium]|nr:ABC transporter permease [Bacillota bacterium]